MRSTIMHCFVAFITTMSVGMYAQVPTSGLAAIPDSVGIVAERANLSADVFFVIVNFDTANIRVRTMFLVGNSPYLRFEAPDFPITLERHQSMQVRVVYNPLGNSADVTDVLVVIGDNIATGLPDTASVEIHASIGPIVPLDTIRLRSIRSVGLVPNTVRFLLVLDTDLKDNVGFAEAIFKYKENELYLGDYTVLSNASDDEWQYTGIRVVPDNERGRGDTIADFHFTILHGTDGGGDTNSVLELVRLEWYAKFTGNHIYTITTVNDDVVSSVDEGNVQENVGTPSQQLSLYIFPNPADVFANVSITTHTYINNTEGADGSMRAGIYSSIGQEVVALTHLLPTDGYLNSQMDNSYSFGVDVSALPRGTYYFRLDCGTNSVVRPFVVM